MNYIGEHLIPGNLGHFLTILSLVASVLATICFFKASRLGRMMPAYQSWIKLARVAFAVETACVIGIFAVLYYIISSHQFEYKYAWQHSSRSLQIQYLLSCFWEGQEGSFMLWSFWHCVLGWIVIWRSRRWEAPVMAVVSFAQFCLATMLLGIYFWGAKVGSSPFVLLRNEGILDNAPIFLNPTTGGLRQDYLSYVKDGQGLNALLQNYWMVIHPPILFLGFASTLIPFAYAIAGLMTKKELQETRNKEQDTRISEQGISAKDQDTTAGNKQRVTAFGQMVNRSKENKLKRNEESAQSDMDYTSWTKHALPWALFSGAILGLGIMMGAKWAYESLNFGGYWAWDPVENASLVPWLVLVAGIHTNLIFRHSGYSLRATYLFYILSFILVLYSTFLTRSGVLGDTSVHAFTDLGMNFQLLAFLFIFLVPAMWMYFRHYKNIPSIQKEESSYSREFWMFIASLIFFLSALVIIGKTSVPVFNKLFHTTIAPPEDVEFSHNQIQIFVAIIIGVLTAITQYFKYKNTNRSTFFKALLLPFVITLVAGVLFIWKGGIDYNKKGPVFQVALYIGVFSALFAIIANAGYVWSGVKGRLRLAGGSVAHVGFGMVLLGILISAGNRKVMSMNTTGISPLKADDPKENSFENTTLIKGLKTDMGNYDVTYLQDTLNPKDTKIYYRIDFEPKSGKKKFSLYPDVIPNNKGAEGMSPNPDAKHYWDHDIFAYVTFLSDPQNKEKDTAQYYNKSVVIGDTLFYSNGMWVVNNLDLNPNDNEFHFTKRDTAFVANITVIQKDGRMYKARPGFILRNNQLEMIPDTVLQQSLIFRLNRLTNADKKEVEISVKESNAILDFITLKVYEFPQINLLWIGVLVTITGMGMSMVRRSRPNPSKGGA